MVTLKYDYRERGYNIDGMPYSVYWYNVFLGTLAKDIVMPSISAFYTGKYWQFIDFKGKWLSKKYYRSIQMQHELEGYINSKYSY